MADDRSSEATRQRGGVVNDGALTNELPTPADQAGMLTDKQRDAEEVRAHLVSLRGGAPFLSPNDGMLLDHWLEAGVSVAAILSALERCADGRRKRASRLPLTLMAAKRHLGKPGKAVGSVVRARGTAEHPLLPVVAKVQALGGEGTHVLSESLLLVEPSDPDRALRDALAAVRVFVETRWRALGSEEREACIQGYLELLELDPDEPASAGYATALGLARDSLRRDWPWLNAATFSELLS
jgi:hypothetical protein